MPGEAPIGTVCAFAGQMHPVSADANSVWGGSGCSSQNALSGTLNPDVPLNHLESQGWMFCDGRALSTASFPELFAVLGYLYGEAAGGDSFLLPDYRGLFLRGVDAGSGMDPQAADRVGPQGSGTSSGIGSLQCDSLQDHTHEYGAVSLTTSSSQGTAGGQVSANETTSSPNPPARFGPESRPKNISVNYIIRFR
jgi:microcystin-dependent protein